MKYKYNDQWLELPSGIIITKETDTPNGCILVNDNQLKVYDDTYINEMRNGHSLLISSLNEAGAALNNDASFADMCSKIIELMPSISTPVEIKSATASSSFGGTDPNVVCDKVTEYAYNNSWYPAPYNSEEYIILELNQESIVGQMDIHFAMTYARDQTFEVLGGTDVNDMRSIMLNSGNYTIKASDVTVGVGSLCSIRLDTGGQPIRFVKMIYKTVAHMPYDAMFIIEFELFK